MYMLSKAMGLDTEAAEDTLINTEYEDVTEETNEVFEPDTADDKIEFTMLLPPKKMYEIKLPELDTDQINPFLQYQSVNESNNRDYPLTACDGKEDNVEKEKFKKSDSCENTFASGGSVSRRVESHSVFRFTNEDLSKDPDEEIHAPNKDATSNEKLLNKSKTIDKECNVKSKQDKSSEHSKERSKFSIMDAPNNHIAKQLKGKRSEKRKSLESHLELEGNDSKPKQRKLVVGSKELPAPTTIKPKKPTDIPKITTKSSPRPKAKVRKQTKDDSTMIYSIYMSEDEMLKMRKNEKNHAQYVKSAYKCKTCIVGFFTSAHLDEHKEKKHGVKNGPYKCEICACRFPGKVTLRSHRVTHYRQFVCNTCGFRDLRSHVVRRHHRTQHDTRVFPCDECDESFLTWNQRYTHQANAHRAPKKCPHCDKVFGLPSAYNLHVKSHAGAPDYKCSVCGKRGSNKSWLVRHVRAHAAPGSADHYCAECDVHFKSRVAYRSHLATTARHSLPENRRYPCDMCDRRFMMECQLREHHDSVHLDKNRCKICGKSYSKKGGLTKHTQKAHEKKLPPKNKICEICQHACRTNGELQSHLLVHTGERPFTCELCEKTFRQQSSLYMHRRLVHFKLKKKKKKEE